MTAQSIREQLAAHPFTTGFRPRQIDLLAAQAREVSFVPGQIIFREGEENDEFYLIDSGRVALEIVVGSKLLRIQTLSDGEEFGWSALIAGRGKYFQARALQLPVKALAFNGSKLIEDCNQDPEFGFTLMRHLLHLVSERLHATRLQLSDTYSPVAKAAGA